MVEINSELAKLLLNHAQVASGQSPQGEILEPGSDLFNWAICDLENNLRRLAGKIPQADKSALLDQLAAAHLGLDFTSTKSLLGL